MSKVRNWTQHTLAADAKFKKLLKNGTAPAVIQTAFGGPQKVSRSTIYRATQITKRDTGEAFIDPSQGKAKKNARREFQDRLLRAVIDLPSDPKLSTSEELDKLRRENILLQEQLRWAQKADPANREGGKMTLVLSDIHLCGRDHMKRCYEEMLAKSLVVHKQYAPDELVVVLNGDAVAGTGIYRNQSNDSIIQSSTDQVKMAVVKIAEFDEMLKENLPYCNVSWIIICGNHDRSQGENITPYFASMARDFGVNAAYGGDFQVLNLASKGTYNILAEHGYGYSKISPSGAGYLSDVQSKLWSLGRTHYAEKRIRRVTHGHTHWFQLGMERLVDLYVDTTGGCQRNERAVLGKNPRPMGFIAYVSPKDYDGILEPIGIRPELETFEEEWADKNLCKVNMDDCGKSLEIYEERAAQLGLTKMDGWEGR